MVTKIKKNKRRRKGKKELSRLLIANLIFFTVLILIGFILYSIYQSWRKSVWDGKHQLNFVIQAKQLMIFSFHPGDSILNILVVSPKTYIPVAHGFGKYEIGNIFKLGQLEKIGGGKLLSLSLQKFLATPIDGYIIQNQKSKIKIIL